MKKLITILFLMLSIACNAQSLKYNIFTTNTPAGFTNSVGLQVTTNGGVFGLSLLIAPGTGITFATNSNTITISNTIYGPFLTVSNTVNSNTANITTVSNLAASNAVNITTVSNSANANTLNLTTVSNLAVNNSLNITTVSNSVNANTTNLTTVSNLAILNSNMLFTVTNTYVRGVAAGTGVTTSTNNGTVTVNASTGSSFINPAMAGGRLTLVSGQPVVTTNATNSIVYYEPYNGNAIALLSSSGTAWATNFPSLSLNLTNIGGVGAGTNIDFFVGTNSSGVLTLTNTLWSSDTARAVAISQTNGIWTISTNIIWRYVGTARTDTTNQIVQAFGGTGANGTQAKLYIWNINNQEPVSASVFDSTDSWSYNSTTWRSVNGSTSNRVSIVVGLPQYILATSSFGCLGNTTGQGTSGIGIDSTTAPTGQTGWALSLNTTLATANSACATNISAGFHYVQAIERALSGSTTYTGYGDNGIANVQNQSLIVNTKF